MSGETESGHDTRLEWGLCSGCRHAAVTRSARGSRFLRCRAAEESPALARYPQVPVETCAALDPDLERSPG